MSKPISSSVVFNALESRVDDLEAIVATPVINNITTTNNVTVSGGNFASAGAFANVDALITHFSTSDLPVVMDSDVTVSSPKTFPANARIVHGGGKFIKSSTGTIAFAGAAFDDPTSMKPIFSGFAAGNITFTGTDYPRRISSSLWADTNWGARALNAAGAFTSKDVIIEVHPGGTPTVQLRVKSGQTWELAAGTFENSITNAQQRCVLMEDNSAFIGQGIGRTIIKESSVDGMQIFITPSLEVVGSRDGLNTNLIVRDFTYQGDPGVSVNSSFPAINMGNTKTFYVGNINCIDSHGYSVNAGGNGALGNCADNGIIENIMCDGLQTQEIAIVNGKNIHILNPIFRNVAKPTSPSQAVIDLEPNSPSDVCENITIVNPIFDLRNAQSSTNGISINAAGAPACKNIRVINPLIIGADNYRANSLPDANFDATTNKIHAVGHGYQHTTQVVLTTTGTLKTGLNTSSTYFVIYYDNDYLGLASSYANALTLTAIDFSGSGSGLHTILPLRKNNVGITVAGGDNVSIVNPVIRGMAQQGISIVNSTGVTVEGGSSRICGGGGSQAMIVAGSSDCDIVGHRLSTMGLGISQSDEILEEEITATVNTTSGSPTVTRTAGSLIYPHWVGKTVTINAVEYVVKSVGNVDESFLVLTTNAASTLTGTTLTTKFSSNRYAANRRGTFTPSSTGTSVESSLVTSESDGSITIPSGASFKSTVVGSMLTYNSGSNYVRVGSTATPSRVAGNPVFIGDDLTTFISSGGKINFDATMTAGGTTGAQTINKVSGSVNFAAAATSLVVTNNKVTTASIIICTVMTNDSTLKSVQAVAGSGTFTIYANAAATAETKVSFLVIN
jgi:hypothetical protein